MVKVICNSSSIALASLVLLTRTAFAQSRPEMAARCEKAEESDQAETAELPVYRSHAMRGALRNEAAVWAFVTDPKTPYMDRMATAYQGAFLTSAQQLPRLWKAKADFDRLPTGVEASPCLLMYSAAPKGPWMTGGSIGRTVPFPHERKDRGQMPIVWQMQKALKILTERTASFNSSPERFRAVAEVALRRQPSEFGERYERYRALEAGERTPFWIETMLRIMLEDGGGPIADFGFAWSYHIEELGHVAHIVVLQSTTDSRLAGEMAFHVSQTAKLETNPQLGLKPLSTATSILAIAKWANDQRLTLWERYFSFASAICRIVVDPPFVRNQQLDPESAEVKIALERFHAWYVLEEPQLRRKAAGERAQLAALAAEIHQRLLW